MQNTNYFCVHCKYCRHRSLKLKLKKESDSIVILSTKYYRKSYLKFLSVSFQFNQCFQVINKQRQRDS